MQYFLSSEGKNLGLFSIEDLRAMKVAGRLPNGAWLWKEGMADWQPAEAILGSDASSRKRRTVWIVAGVLAAVVGVGGILLLAVAAPMLASRFREGRVLSGESSSEVQIAGKAIVQDTNSLTETRIRERSRQFRVRQYLEAYKTRGERDQSYDEDALRMIEGWIQSNYDAAGAPARDDLTQLANKIAGNPKCTDVVLLIVTANTGGSDAATVTERLERAVDNAANSRHRGYPKFYATVRLAQMVRDAGRVTALNQTALKYFREALQDGGLVGDDQQELAEILANGWGKDFFQRNADDVCHACSAAGSNSKWLGLVLSGEQEVKAAWKARGGGFVDSVSEKGWEGFAAHSAKAREHFTRAWELHPDWPAAPASMVYVAMGDSDLEDMRRWFDRATSAQVDSYPAWHNMIWGLRPRWHGNLEAIKALGYAAVDSGRFDTDVPRKYFDAITAIEAEMQLRPGQTIFGRSDIWPRLQTMYEGYIAHPNQLYVKGWRTSYAVVAYFAGKYDIAEAQMQALERKPLASNLEGWVKDLSLLPQELAARTGPADKLVAAAESAYAKADTRAAQARYSEIGRRSDLGEQGKRFVDTRLATLELEAAFNESANTDEWVAFLPKTLDDPAWVFVKGKWQAALGRLEVAPEEQGHLAYSRLRVGANLKVRGEFDLVNGPKNSFQGGIVLGLPTWTGSSWYALRILKNENASNACFASGWGNREIYQPVTLKETGNAFEFTLQGGKMKATVNAKEVFAETPIVSLRGIPEREYSLGFIGYEPKDAAIRYRNVEVKKLQP